MAALTEHRVRIPLRVPVRGVEARVVTLLEGPAGWGECSPLPGDGPPAVAAARRAAEEAASVPWPAPVRDTVVCNALVPGVGPAEAARAAAAAVADGYRCVKVKVGDSGDVDRVAAVREAVGPAVAIRVDANGAWRLDEAEAALARLGRHGLELAEQPVATLEEMAALRRRVGVPLAADESVRTVDDACRLAALEAADAVVLKVQPLGGVRAAMEVAEAAGVAAIVTSMLETSVGLAAGLALAAALPELPYACGLGTAGLLAGDVVADPLVPERGVLAVRRPVPDPGLLAAWEDGP
ncbi:MAG: o-succinylbenzoate synthase [Acidimicrobiia bacterium]|nr:o-succinylbenzoate synthase [Acidimicrobiia bacterium]